jgi:Sulfatase
LQIAKSIVAPGPNVLVAIAFAAGMAAVFAFVRSERARQIARYLPIATVFYLVLFLAFSPASNAIFGGEGDVSAAAGIDNPKRVVMVVFDEFPLVSLLDGDGAIDAELYPNFAELAGDSTWYRNSTTIAPYTWLAIPSMVSGQYPTDHLALPTSREWPDTVFTLLSDAYEMNVTEIVTGLCPSSVCTGRRTGGIKSLASTTKDLWTNFSAPHSAEFSFNEDEGTEITLSETRRFIRNIKPSTGPVLDFAHIELPHQPWHYLPTLQDTEVTIGAPGSAYYLWSNQEFADVARQRHLLQVQAVDKLLGDMIAKLKKIGEWDDSLVIFTADHGVAFQEREPLRSVSRANYTDIMWTPTFVHYPGQTDGVVDDRPVQSIDILPTIADVIDAEVPWDMVGRSMLGEPRDEAEPLRIYQWGELGFEPTDVLKPTDGREFLEFDGIEGFASVLERRAAPPAESMRMYRRGEWADLIGQPVAGLVEDRAGDELVGLTNYGSYFGVDPTGSIAQWAYGEGTFNRLERIEPVAVAVNGRVAYVTTPSALKREGDALFAFLVPPDLIVAGNNTIEIFLVSGSPDSPSLDPVEINRL